MATSTSTAATAAEALPGASAIERAGLLAWPGLEVEWDGQWVRRAAGGYTKRANSVQSLDPADDGDAPARLAASRTWFESRGLQPVFRVTPLAGPGILRALDAAGWISIDHSRLMAMPLGDIEADPSGVLFEPLDLRFLDVQQRLQGYSVRTVGKLRDLLGALTVAARGVVHYSPDRRPVAASLMAVAGGIVVTGNVVTDPNERRKGYAAAMMRTGLAWARQAGATVAALNVAAENSAGLGLYRSLGYRAQYEYRYRVPQA